MTFQDQGENRVVFGQGADMQIDRCVRGDGVEVGFNVYAGGRRVGVTDRAELLALAQWLRRLDRRKAAPIAIPD